MEIWEEEALRGMEKGP
jgi:hypothetical protein